MVIALLVLAGVVQMMGSVANADWPEFRGDRQRSAFRYQTIDSRIWEPNWIFDRMAPPQPAWPEPARGSLWQNLTQIEARVVDDHANVPLIAPDKNGQLHVLIASSTDDQLVSIDPRHGKVLWQVDTGGPIRFAPSTENGIAFFGADDGWVRAVEISTGNLLWKTRLGPSLPQIIGNQRLISPHPVRTSVVVTNEIVVAHAGLFPSQGVYSVALNKKNGDVVWRRRLEKSPQGYLLANKEDRVFVPTGRSSPYAVEAGSGKYLYDLPSPGGSFCMLTSNAFFTGPGNLPEVHGFQQLNRAKMLTFRGRQVAAGRGLIWTANGSKLACHNMQQVMAGQQDAVQWSVDCHLKNAMIVAGDEDQQFVIVAGDREIDFFSARTGERVFHVTVPEGLGNVVHLAVSESVGDQAEILVCSTDRGRVLCWKGTDDPAGSHFTALAVPETKQGVQGTERMSRLGDQVLKSLRSKKGFALVVEDAQANWVDYLLTMTRLHVAVVVPDRHRAIALRKKFREKFLYGKRVSVHVVDNHDMLPFASELFNLVVGNEKLHWSKSDCLRLLYPGSGLLCWDGLLEIKPDLPGVGGWRHQYASPANQADSRDAIVGNAAGFRLQWFGGVGPSRMPDRHLRGPAPLAVGSAMIMQTDGGLIGVDPANGTERWSMELPPNTLRLVTPYDGGYSCLDEDGQRLFIAAPEHVFGINSMDGEIIKRIALPDDLLDQRWGYLAVGQSRLVASVMKKTAPRVAADRGVQRAYVDQDYRSNRPLVCSRQMISMTTDGRVLWRYESQGPIPNGTISIDEKTNRIVFIEGRSKDCLLHPSDRISANDIMEEGWVNCLDLRTGQLIWEHAMDWPEAHNVLYTQIDGDVVVLSTSESLADKARYHLRVLSTENGKTVWHAAHNHVKGGLFHGEQVHHPVLLRRNNGRLVLVAEPFFYDLKTGNRTGPTPADIESKSENGRPSQWAIRRPGHSCGTLSGAGNCLFFRATNPTVLNLNLGAPEFTALAPSRPGCWINMLPATGRLLIPEASASCVCQFSLQTSMAFVPIKTGQMKQQLPILKDVAPRVKQEKLNPVFGWRFDKAKPGAKQVAPEFGSHHIQASSVIKMAPGGLKLDGQQWLCLDFEEPALPNLPQTMTVESCLVVQESGKWGGIVGAIQDNGSYEKGFLLGIHDQRFFFAVAGGHRNQLTYLHAPTLFEKQKKYHLVATYDGTMMKLFVNGAPVSQSKTQSGPIQVDPNSWLAVGAYKDSDELYLMKGAITSAFIYQGVMTDRQVMDRFLLQKPNP